MVLSLCIARYIEPGNFLPGTDPGTSRGRGHGDVEVVHIPLLSLVLVRFGGEHMLARFPVGPMPDLCSSAF